MRNLGFAQNSGFCIKDTNVKFALLFQMILQNPEFCAETQGFVHKTLGFVRKTLSFVTKPRVLRTKPLVLL